MKKLIHVIIIIIASNLILCSGESATIQPDTASQENVISDTGSKNLKVQQIFPTSLDAEIPVNTSIFIIFSRQVNENSIAANISITPALSFSYNLDSDKKSLRITPSGNLSYNTQYTITVSKNISAADTEPLDKDYSVTFKTASNPTSNPVPVVVSKNPVGNNTDPNTSILSVIFSKAVTNVNSSTFFIENHSALLSGSPYSDDGGFTWKQNLITPLPKGEKFTVLLKSEITDTSGKNLVIDDNASWSFITTDDIPVSPTNMSALTIGSVWVSNRTTTSCDINFTTNMPIATNLFSTAYSTDKISYSSEIPSGLSANLLVHKISISPGTLTLNKKYYYRITGPNSIAITMNPQIPTDELSFTTLDTVGGNALPVISVNPAVIGTINSSTYNITIDVYDDYGITNNQITVNGTTCNLVNGRTTYTINLTSFKNINNTFNIVATDFHGFQTIVAVPFINGLFPEITAVPDSGNFTGSQVTSLSATNGATMKYRINQSGAWGLWQTYSGSFTITTSCVIEVEAVNAYGTATKLLTYSLTGVKPSVSLSPVGAAYNTNQLITITATNAPTIVEYKIDSGSWQTYTAPFTISASCTISARATNGFGTDTIGPSAYLIDTINTDPPEPVTFSGIAFTVKSGTMTIVSNSDSTANISKNVVGNAICIYNPTINKSNYVVTGEIQLISGTRYGITFRMQNDSLLNGYVFQYNADKLRLVYFNSNEPTYSDNSIILPDPSGPNDNEWHSFIFVVNGDIIKIYLDGQLRYEVNSTSAFFLSGTPPRWNTGGLGFRFWQNAEVKVRNWQFQEINP